MRSGTKSSARSNTLPHGSIGLADVSDVQVRNVLMKLAENQKNLDLRVKALETSLTVAN